MTFGSSTFGSTTFGGVAPLKKLIIDVKEKTEIACREAKGTATEKVVCEINKVVQDLRIGNQEDMKMQVENLYNNLKSSVPNKEEYSWIHQEIDNILVEDDLVNQYSSLNMLIPKIIEIKVVETTKVLSGEIRGLKESVNKLIESIKDMKISLKPGIKEEIQVIVGISGFGSGVQKVITIPIQEISYSGIQDDIQKCSDKMMDIAKLPARLKDKIMKYLRENEDKLES